ncbi:MAG: DUF4403 family protein [Deltaproteobacteria bacterium]|nr:DUF4403 family protein [Deltaproteobacteria bacterium]
METLQPARARWVLVLLGVFLAGAALYLYWPPVSPPAEGPPRGAALQAPPEPRSSVIVVPVAIPLADLAASIESSVPQVLVDTRGQAIQNGFLVDVHAERTGPVRAMGRAGKLVFEVPIEVSALAYRKGRAEKRSARGKDPTGPRVEAGLVVEMALDLALTDDWSLEPNTVMSHRWTEKPRLSLGPLHFGIEKLADRQLVPMWPDVAARVDARIREEDRFRVGIEQAWTRLGTPSLVGEAPTTWWMGTPQALYASAPVVGSDALELTVGIVGRFGLLVGSPGVAPPLPTLPPRRDPPADTGFHLELPVTLTWEELSQLASAAVAGQTWSLPGEGARAGTVVLEAVELYPSGDRVVVAVAYSARSPVRDTAGTLHLAGRLVVDSERRVVTVEDFDYVVETWDRAVSSAAVLAASGVKEALQERLVFPFGAQLDTAREQADAGLSEVRTDQGALIRGHLEALEIRAVRLTDVGVVVDTVLSGELSMRGS